MALRSILPTFLLKRSLKFGPVRNFHVTSKINDYKAELTAKQMNNDNPFDTYVMKPEAGRGLLKNDPILVPSMNDSRYRL